MRYRAILLFAVMTLGLGVAGCGGGGNIGDLVDKATGLIPDTKKALPGERKAVFPEGVPGVPQGVPPELVKGYQAEPQTAAAPEPGAEQTGAVGGPKQAKTAEPEDKPKPKPKKKIAAKPPQTAQPTQPTQNQGNQGAWPGVQPAPQSQPQPATAWPAPQPSQPTAAWPDPRQKPAQ